MHKILSDCTQKQTKSTIFEFTQKNTKKRELGFGAATKGATQLYKWDLV